MSGGCPYIAGPACPDCDGSCWHPQQEPPAPTVEEYCASLDHAYYGDDGDGSEGTMGRCYCGEQVYPAGGSPAPAATEAGRGA